MREFFVWFAIARVGFREIARDKVFYTSLFAAVLLLLLGLLASRLSFLTQDRVVRDFGLSALRLANGAIGILFASSLIAKELERRTAFVALARPITRSDFVIGKYLGLLGILFVNGLLLSLTYFLLLSVAGNGGSSAIAIASTLAIIESFAMAALALFLSTQTTPTLSVLFATGVWLIGSNSTQLRSIASNIEPTWLGSLLGTLSRLIPSFEPFHLGFRLTYELPIPLRHFLGAAGYGFLLTVLFVFLAGIAFRRKEI